MLTLFISILISVASVYAGFITNQNTGATVGFGVAGFFLPLLLIGWIVRKKAGSVQKELEGMVMSGQKRMTRQVQMFQAKPGGDPKRLQRKIEKDQLEISRKALDYVANFEPLKKWSLTMGKQIATMRLQFLYQQKEFEQVDELLASGGLFSGPMMMEPLLVAMKMARQYKNKEIAAAEKTFNRRVKWFRGNRGSLLYGVMSWIYMKEGESDKAHQLLLKGKEITANEVLTRNCELLSNNKNKQFSNAGFGDEWYSLYLENPPNPKQQRMRGNAQGGRRF